ncbi:MAG: redoxin domain-containing protein, partial [Nitrospira sp.]|nr:redoxin domain-containing protein [Nitrospira sp.]
MKQRLFVAIFSGFMLLSVTLVQAGSFFKIGEAAPDFTLTSLDGQSVTLSQFKGKVVVLGLFHICEPCLIQGTNLQKVYEATRGKSVAVVGVNSSGDSSADVTEFLHS